MLTLGEEKVHSGGGSFGERSTSTIGRRILEICARQKKTRKKSSRNKGCWEGRGGRRREGEDKKNNWPLSTLLPVLLRGR